jgi:RNA polymerase sigma factor (sigma-70 family)
MFKGAQIPGKGQSAVEASPETAPLPVDARPAASALREPPDNRLAERISHGDRSAFEHLYRRHRRGVLSFCRRTLRSPDDAEDAVQQTFLSAYADLVSGVQPEYPKAWLYGIARNRCLEMLRSRHRSSSLVEKSTADVAEEIERRADVRELLASLKQLPHEQRMALALFKLGELSHADIARVLDCKPARVKALVFQARSTLLADREAGEIPCREIRKLLATQPGSALRGRSVRLHVRRCRGCSDFYRAIRHRRHRIASALLPAPMWALQGKMLATIGHAQRGTAPDGGVTLLPEAAAAKLALVAIALSGVAITDRVVVSGSDPGGVHRSTPVFPGAGPGPAVTPTAPRGSVGGLPGRVRSWVDPPTVSIWQPTMRREPQVPGGPTTTAGDALGTGEVDGAVATTGVDDKQRKGHRSPRAGPGKNGRSGADGGTRESGPGEERSHEGKQPSQRAAGDRALEKERRPGGPRYPGPWGVGPPLPEQANDEHPGPLEPSLVPPLPEIQLQP